MKLLLSSKWKPVGYDSERSAWIFRNDNMQDWEECITPRAKFVDQKNDTVSIFHSSGVIETKQTGGKWYFNLDYNNMLKAQDSK